MKSLMLQVLYNNTVVK